MSSKLIIIIIGSRNSGSMSSVLPKRKARNIGKHYAAHHISGQRAPVLLAARPVVEKTGLERAKVGHCDLCDALGKHAGERGSVGGGRVQGGE